MTACVNRKHTKKVAAVVTASLVGALSLGVAPVAAMATDEGIEMQFADPEGAFTNAKVVDAGFSHLGSWRSVGQDGYGVYETTYDAYKPMVLDWFEVEFFGTSESGSFKISAASDDYEVTYYERDSKGMPTGDAITSDIYSVGKYVAKVEAVDGHYKGGVIYVPFDINAIELSGAEVVGSDTVTYNAETHDFRFNLIDSNGVRYTAMEGVDYTVEYVRTGHDATVTTDVKDQGTYVAKITGIGNWAGSVTLSEKITVNPLNLSTTTVVGLTASGDEVEPKNLFGLFIDGKFYTGDDAIMSELKADLTDDEEVWFDNRGYSYDVTEATANDANIDGYATFYASKVEHMLDFYYNGEPVPASHEIIMSDSSTAWDRTKVTAHADNSTVAGIDIANGDINQIVYDSNGNVASSSWQTTPGTYTMIISYDGSLSGYDAGGQAVVTFTVYKEAVNADATAAVLYDVDGDGTKEVVSSVEAAYDGTDLAGRIETVVETANGYRLMPVRDYTVRYYSADGTQVRTLIDAGTYTLKVTSDIYKLTGTTEMTVTINKIGTTNVKAAAVTDKKWDNVGNVTSYLPWQADGVTLDELNLQYKDGDSWVPFPMDVIKATILDSEGNEVKKIEEEGVYTIHFEGRNPNADNYVVPGDITITCIKDGTEAEEDGSHVNHLIFTDVNYIDYFADPVNYVANKKFMNGYANTNVFGSYDNLTSGQVACVLYNMALDNRKDDETDLVYTEDKGYITGFSDVDGKAYYGAAIAWAKQAGVVNGYGDGTFKPEQTVTREEFCAMLANYASKYEDGYAEGDAATLADFEDADQVSEWAEKVVAWGVENGIIGNGGFLAPSASIIRADAACMVYNYAEAE